MNPKLNNIFLKTEPFKKKLISLFLFFEFWVYFWLHWIFIAALRLSLAAPPGGAQASHCSSFSCCRARGPSSALVVHQLRCFEEQGIFSNQGSNLCPLHWQADSYPLHHQGSPETTTFKRNMKIQGPTNQHNPRMGKRTVYQLHHQSQINTTLSPFLSNEDISLSLIFCTVSILACCDSWGRKVSDTTE